LNDAYLVPAQKDNNGVPTGVVFIVPRNDDILYVGSIIQPHNDQANLEPGSPEVRVMWDRAAEFMPSLRHADFVHHYPFAQGLRPFTKKNVKVRADTQAGFPLVHNYGHGGSGWTLGFGTARCAVYILKALLEEDYGEADEKWNQKAEKINEKIYGKQE
jgi:glycine/D-amino acid oxidase-like deaminating enzyme